MATKLRVKQIPSGVGSKRNYITFM